MMNSCGGAPISIENALDDAVPPDTFQCINRLIFRPPVQEPDPSFLIGCDGGCSCKAGAACSCISLNGEVNAFYSPQGRLLIDSGPIYECNERCGCDPLDCPNRVIQQGRTLPLMISRFGGDKGWGVRAASDIPRGSFIDLYLGEVITSEEANGRFVSAEGGPAAQYLFDLDFGYEIGCESEFTIDASTYGNVTHFINHSCDPNLTVHPVFIDSHDSRLHHLAFFAKRDIGVGEELCFDYLGSQAAAKTSKNPGLRCDCGASKCRGFVY